MGGGEQRPVIGSSKRYEEGEGEGEGRGVMCHLSQGLFPLEEGRGGGRERGSSRKVGSREWRSAGEQQ